MAFLASVSLGPVSTGPAAALDSLRFSVPGAGEALQQSLRKSSLLLAAAAERKTDAQNLFASARAEYGRLVGALYADGYYGGVISILIDGREAADIDPLDAPARISRIDVSVKPGPRFVFSAARMKPYAPGTKLPSAYRDTLPAKSTAIFDAAKAGVEGWRDVGHAKADVAGQSIVADHRSHTLRSEILLAPGPKVRFGTLNITGYARMRPERIRKIAGFPTGEVYSPADLETVGKRLRRTGVFSSVTVRESDRLGSGDTLDVDLVLSEAKLHRFGVGAEVSGTEGLSLSGYWLHRNLLGGGEQLKFDAAVDRIGGSGNDMDYNIGVRIDRPATPVTDANAFAEVRLERIDLAGWTVDSQQVAFGLTRFLSDSLFAQASLAYANATATDAIGSLNYEWLSLPVTLTWDRRDNPVDTRKGFYLEAAATPFLGFGSTGSGAQITADARYYQSFGVDKGLVLAGRMQLGTVTGAGITQTPPTLLFLSGGAGTVRGQPYQSLDVTVPRPGGGTIDTGGASFVGLSGELRARVTERIDAVAFYDVGSISTGDFFGGTQKSHSGAGLGVRYDTGFGPIRLDVAAPVTGATGSGVQIYIGIGQAF
jgi:translocation and assembly module TamA